VERRSSGPAGSFASATALPSDIFKAAARTDTLTGRTRMEGGQARARRFNDRSGAGFS